MRPFFLRPNPVRADIHEKFSRILASVDSQLDAEFAKLPKPRPWRAKPEHEPDESEIADVEFRVDPGPVSPWRKQQSAPRKSEHRYPYASRVKKT